MNAQNGAQSVYGLPMCPAGGQCRDCDRTSAGCVAIWADADHAEALRINAKYPPGHPRLESMASFAARVGLDALYRLTGQRRPECDCPLDPHHRWNCALTPIWAQTIRDLTAYQGLNRRPFAIWPGGPQFLQRAHVSDYREPQGENDYEGTNARGRRLAFEL